MHAHERLLLTLMVLLLAMPVGAQESRSTAVIWHDRGDAAALDLIHGPGGKDREPGAEFRFIGESKSGTSPKFDVKDEHGVTWKVKLGEEVRSETAASRLLWAAGYVVDEDYYLPQIRVLGLPRLARGQEFVSNGNTVTGVRLERDPGGEDSTPWSWYDNPFLGTREFNGLKVMMALVNNWDLKAVNNGASGAGRGGGQYGITDLGATLGRTGNSLTRSKGVVSDYADSQFIDKVTPTYVDFVMHSRPFFLTSFNVSNYRFRTRMESVVRHIPVADARWIGQRLGRLSREQIGDCFRASGFSPAEAEAYTQVVMGRIVALEHIGEVKVPAEREAKASDTDARECLESTCRQVPVRETLTAIGLGTAYVQAIVGGFDQGAGITGGVQLTSADEIPAMQLRVAALTSTAGYLRFDVGAFIPKVGSSRNHADIWASYLQRDVDVFGTSPQTSADLETQFAMTRRSYQGSLSRDLTSDLEGGVYAQVMDSRALLNTSTTTSQVLSYGGFLVYDTRDTRVGLTRGLNLFGRIASSDGLGQQVPAASYAWVEKEFDARAYVPLGSPRTSLLMRSWAQFKTAKGGRQIPFYDRSWLGGRRYLRGYHSYQFRGDNVLLFSTELQQTVVSMTPVRGLDLFASADTGQVWGDARSSILTTLDAQRFSSHNWHSGVGGGVQYRHSRSLGARIEASHSRERTAIYVSVSRGF